MVLMVAMQNVFLFFHVVVVVVVGGGGGGGGGGGINFVITEWHLAKS